MGKIFNPANMNRLLDPARKQWQDPDQVLRHLDLGPHTVMADVGCGPGWFTLEAAKRMQPDGLVYGVDISEEMLARLKERADAESITNVKPTFAEDDAEFPVPTESCDAVLIANVYHEVDPASMFLTEIKRMLKPGAICLVVDWKPEETPVGPPLDERLDPEDVVQEFAAMGFALAENCDCGPFHYGLKFTKVPK